MGFVDELYFGRRSYRPVPGPAAERDRFYAEQARTVRAFCERHRIRARIES